MRKLASLLLALTLITNISTVSAQATGAGSAGSEKSMIAPLPPVNSNEGVGFLGQDHFYTVTFRGNGEAVVNLKAIFANSGETPLSTLEFRIPKIDPQDLVAYQVIRDRECVRWNPYNDYPIILPDASGISQEQDMMYRQPTCMQYQEPNYYNYYYGNNKYQKADVSKNGDTVTVTLPTAVEPDKSASIILYYRGVGYASKNWAGAYSFKFETAKVQDKIRTLQVGINTDSDMVMKQAQGDVNYRLQAADSVGMAKIESPTAAMSNAQFDQIYQNIGYGTLVKNASELAPLDSYTVTGDYAKSGWQLYANTILIAVVIALVLLLALVVGIRYALRKLRSTSSGKAALLSSRDFIIAGATGFGSAFLMLCYTILVMIIFYAVTYRTYGYYEALPFASIAMMIVSSAVYMFLFVTPAVVVGVKRGLWAGVTTAIVTIIWLFIFLAVTLGGYMLIRAASPGGYPVPMMMRGIESDVMKSNAVTEPAQAAPDVIQSDPATPSSIEGAAPAIQVQPATDEVQLQR